MNKALALLTVLTVSFIISASNVLAIECKADMTCDGKVNASDLGIYKLDYGKINCDPWPGCNNTCDGTLSPLGRWCDQNNGTVKDMTTGLVWLKDAGWGDVKQWVNTSTWDDAHTRAGTLRDGMTGEPSGLTDGSVEGDWRLPTKSELVGITVGDEYIRSGQTYFFTNVQFYYYWSSTTYAGDLIYAWGVDMLYGYVDLVSKTYGCYVWPVRGGNS